MSLIKDIEIDDLMLLHGKPILIPTTRIKVQPFYLKEISSIGVNYFFELLNTLTLDFCKIINIPDDKLGLEETIPIYKKNFIILMLICSQNEDFGNLVAKSIKAFTREQVFYSKEFSTINFVFEDDDNRFVPLTAEVFEALQYIVKEQNFLSKEEKEKYNPNSDKAKNIVNKIKKGREKIDEAKKIKNNVTFSDLVGSLAAKGNGLNIFNIWNMNYYAFNDQLQRLKMIEDYDNGLRSLLAGADNKKVKLEYWIRNIHTT